MQRDCEKELRVQADYRCHVMYSVIRIQWKYREETAELAAINVIAYS